MNNDAQKEIRGDAVLILGYSREGQSVHRFLHTHFPKLRVDIADTNNVSPLAGMNATVYTGSDYLASLSKYSTVIRSPGIPPHIPELLKYMESGGFVTSATNIFLSQYRNQTVGVTGTKGKSTTASLIAHILKSKISDVRLVGNIGLPMLDYVDSVSTETVFVAELSSHQLSDTRYSPRIAVMLAIAPEHLDYYQSLESYIHAKANIARFQTSTDALVCNLASSHISEIAKSAPAKKYVFNTTWSRDVSTYIKDGVIVCATTSGEEMVMNISDVPLLGNTENIMAAVTVSRLFDIAPRDIGQAIHPFTPLPHRLEPVGVFGGISFYNDSLATIPEATVHALSSFGDRVDTLIAGGYDRGLNFDQLGEYLSIHPVGTLILFPDTGAKIWDAIQKRNPMIKIAKFDVSTMEEAVKLAYAHTQAGKICLLSPASASYNLFRDYADRGDQFKRWVEILGEI